MDLTCTFECRTVSLSFVSYVSHGKAASAGGGKNDHRVSVPALGRRLFLCRFTPFTCDYFHLGACVLFRSEKTRQWSDIESPTPPA